MKRSVYLLFPLLAGLSAEASTISMVFTALPSTYQNGTYNGFAAATIDGLPGQFVICDDYAHETYMPSSSELTFYESTLTGPNPLQYVRFTDGDALLNYREAAVLLAQLSNLVADGHATGNDITNYQYALWNLFDPAGAPVTTAQQNLQTSALNAVQEGGPTALDAYSRLVIYTPTAQFDSNQEFLRLNIPTGVPEPSAAPVLTLILGVACLVARRRR